MSQQGSSLEFCSTWKRLLPRVRSVWFLARSSVEVSWDVVVFVLSTWHMFSLNCARKV